MKLLVVYEQENGKEKKSAQAGNFLKAYESTSVMGIFGKVLRKL